MGSIMILDAIQWPLAACLRRAALLDTGQADHLHLDQVHELTSFTRHHDSSLTIAVRLQGCTEACIGIGSS